MYVNINRWLIFIQNLAVIVEKNATPVMKNFVSE